MMLEEKIRLIYEKSELSQQDFAKKIGIAPATISGIFNGRTKATTKIIDAIHKSFPEINVNWLMFDEGEMYCKSYSEYDAVVQPTAGQDLFSQEYAQQEAATPEPAASATSSSSVSSRQPSKAVTVEPIINNVSDSSKENAKNTDKTERRIKEIRVFYEDSTYEVFLPVRG